MDDLALLRVERQLGAALGLIKRACEESEAWDHQGVADELFDHWVALTSLHAKMLAGRRPRVDLRTGVRIR